MYKFNVNGKMVTSYKDQKLIYFLRDELNLTSVKNGCSEGACGTCMVIVNDKAMKACVLKTSKLENKNIITVEGLSKREKLVYSYAFAKVGAVQCGFCIPGMVMSAKALLDVNLNPTLSEVKNAIKNNICRCTGYKKIEQAILLSAKIFRENVDIKGDISKGFIGDNLFRVDAVKKVLGTAEYVDDIRIDGMIFGGAVRSKYPRAIIKNINILKAKELPGVVTILTAEDIPGNKKIGHLKKDWDVLIKKGSVTHYIGDAIVLIAAESIDILEKAKSLVEIEYEELSPISNAVESMKNANELVHPNTTDTNVLFVQKLSRGNADKAIKNSKYVVKNKYSTPFTEHAFLEPESAVAMPYKGDGILIYSADQGVYQTQKECAEALGLPLEKVRVIAKNIGGGFGGKEDMSVQHFAALLSYKTKKPVKVSLSRQESIIVHPKRHAMEMEFILACDENGKLTAMKATIIADSGAYASLGGPVLQRACTHAAGPYNYQNIEILGKAVYTNNPPAGAFRGFGVTQSCFANECNLDKLAELVGISPWEIRYRNAIRPGQTLPNGQIADNSTALVETLEAVKDEYNNNKYVGIACAMKNSGLGVGVPDIGRCTLYVKGQKVYINTSAACIGQGMGTVVTQIVCDTTGLFPSLVVHSPPDTKTTPNSGNTTASRQTVFTGEATRQAALKLKKALKNATLEELEGEKFEGEFSFKTDAIGSELKNPVSHIAYGYATHLVVLDNNGVLKKVVAAHDVGRAINPHSLEGQIEGGVVMSLGYALTENYPLENSVPTAKFGTLGLFKSPNVPEIETIIVEKNDEKIAYGAKGVGEICSIPTPPAVALAYYKYDGNFRTVLPLSNTPYSKNK